MNKFEKMMENINVIQVKVLKCRKYNTVQLEKALNKIIALRSKFEDEVLSAEILLNDKNEFLIKETLQYVDFIEKLLCKSMSNATFDTCLGLLLASYHSAKKIDEKSEVENKVVEVLNNVKNDLLKQENIMSGIRIRSIKKILGRINGDLKTKRKQ